MSISDDVMTLTWWLIFWTTLYTHVQCTLRMYMQLKHPCSLFVITVSDCEYFNNSCTIAF